MVHVERLEHMVLLRDTSSMVHYATCVRIARHCLFLFGGGGVYKYESQGRTKRQPFIRACGAHAGHMMRAVTCIKTRISSAQLDRNTAVPACKHTHAHAPGHARTRTRAGNSAQHAGAHVTCAHACTTSTCNGIQFACLLRRPQPLLCCRCIPASYA